MVAPCKPPRAPPLPTAARPPPFGNSARRSEKSLPQYGSVTKPVQATMLSAVPTAAKTKKSECRLERSKQRPVGPLARVPSQPSLVTPFVIDFEKVAHKVEVGGTPTSAEALLHSLKPTSIPHADPSTTSAPHSYPPRGFIHGDDLWESDRVIDPDIYDRVLQVVRTKENPEEFSDESLVLKIREQQHAKGDRSGDNSEVAIQEHEDDATNGFALAIPVNKDRDPFKDDGPSSWEHGVLDSFQKKEVDEENPLILKEQGLNMTARSTPEVPIESQAYVRRYGSRDVASEQEVVLAVNAEKVTSRKAGFLLPVIDSKDDLKQLMFIRPPQEDLEGGNEETPLLDDEPESTTTDTPRDIVDSISRRVPPMLDVESSLEVYGTASRASVKMVVTKQVTWVGYIILAIALTAVASQGTAAKWLPDVGGLIPATWLMQTQALFMIPFAIFQYFTLTQKEREKAFHPRNYRRILFASLSQVCWAAGFFISIDYTSLFHAWCYNNLHSVILVIYAMATQARTVARGEVSGVQIALAGVSIMQIPAMLSADRETVQADLIATIGSLGAIAFLYFCKKLRDEVPLFLMMTPVSILNAIFLSIGSVVVNGTDFSISDHGAFGWMRSDRVALGMYLGGVVGFLGSVCCVAALKFLPDVVVGSVQTMMPVAGTVVAVIAGVDDLPDFWSTIGGFALLYGVLKIVDATRQSEDTYDVNDSISEVGFQNSEKEAKG